MPKPRTYQTEAIIIKKTKLEYADDVTLTRAIEGRQEF